MYLRTSRRRNKDGSTASYFHLAHNERDPATGITSAKIIHNFGRTDELDRDSLVRLTRSIARVCNLVVVDPLTEALPGPTELPEGVSLLRTLELGTLVAAEALWERLGIGPALRLAEKKAGVKASYERALFAMTANRLCEPESKLGVWDRWLGRVFLPSCENLTLDQMYEAMDLFHEHAATVEEFVFFETSHLFNLDVDVIFYDTTTASFHLDDEDPEGAGIRKWGRAKEGMWSCLVKVALAVTREGLPVRSWVFPGDTSDVDTVARVKSDLASWRLGRALFVADSGFNSVDTKRDLAKACGKYLLATRMGAVKEIYEDVLGRPGRYKELSDNLRVKEVIVGDGVRERRYLLCHNPHEAERQRRHRERVLAELETELASHPNRSATAKWAAELRSSGRYGRYVRVNARNLLEINRDAIAEAKREEGKWVIETNDDTLTPEDAAFGYRAAMLIERCFRCLKTTRIAMTPMYHWLPRRIESHVKVCVLALLIERAAELRAEMTWPRIRETLRTLQATEFATPSGRFFQRNEPGQALATLLKKLEIPLPKKVLSVSASPNAPKNT